MAILLNSCSKNEEEVFYYRYISLPDELIYEDGKHNAFTDMCKYRGHYYLCFRNAATHAPKLEEEYGRVFIYESKNRKTWNKVLVVSDMNCDLRDPKLVVDASGRLVLYCGCCQVINGNLFFYGTKAGRIDLEKKTCSLTTVCKDYWLWRVVWEKGKAYSMAYNENHELHLFDSDDGLQWNAICKPEVSGCNEVALYFTDDSRMHAIIRTIYPNTLIGSSDFPYKYWQFDSIPEIIQSPVVYKVNDKEVLLAGRSVDTAGLCFVSLYKLAGGPFIDTLWRSQAGVDNAYPGLVRANNEIILSYYTGDKNSGAIYLKKFRMVPY